MKLPKNFLRWEAKERLVGYKVVYTDIVDGDVIAGLMLSQIVYYHLPSHFGDNRDNKLYVQKKGKQWLVKSEHDWYKELRFTKSRSRRALANLVKKGLIETKIYRFKGTPTTHIFLNINTFLELWLKYTSPESTEKELYQSTEKELYQNAEKDLSESTESSQSLIKRSKKIKRDRQKEAPPPTHLFLVWESLKELNQSFNKPMTGLESLAKKLVKRGVTNHQVMEVWQKCQLADRPCGAFMYWIFNDALPQLPTAKMASAAVAVDQQNKPYQELLGEVLGEVLG